MSPESKTMNPARRVFEDAVRVEAATLYAADHQGALAPGALWKAPESIQEDYIERARKVLGEYLATHGIV